MRCRRNNANSTPCETHHQSGVRTRSTTNYQRVLRKIGSIGRRLLLGNILAVEVQVLDMPRKDEAQTREIVQMQCLPRIL